MLRYKFIPCAVFALGSIFVQSISAQPAVRLNRENISLQRNLYPDYYSTVSAANDIRWVTRNDSALTAFWQNSGQNVLSILESLSGIRWSETNFDIYLIRYYPSIGEGMPTIIPVGGIKNGSLVEAAPSGNEQYLNIMYQLARRLLTQATRSNSPVAPYIVNHPLMQDSPLRRDNLAMLLALVTAQRALGQGQAQSAINSPVWMHNFPSRELFEEYLYNKWVLTPEKPLSAWLMSESYAGDLVNATRTVRANASAPQTESNEQIDGIPPKGKFGFSVALEESNRLVVDNIDPSRAASACGLQVGDAILYVDGIRPKTHKELVEKIYAGIGNGNGMSKVAVIRDGKTINLFFRSGKVNEPEEKQAGQ
ncbi:MAG: PDZ domain-containing protein [candidate division Zixibacteria bacterium]|nr:PDZ domain-containing protein [candidate division Zixibacteria bacterium]